MTHSIDLNADLGEAASWDPKGSDAALLEIVTSANIACGFHAGDPLQMAQLVERALQNGVTIGAHPGFNDREGFGRRRLVDLPAEQLTVDLIYQIAALQGIARSKNCKEGGNVVQVKLHGALANMVSEDFDLARTCVQAVMACDPSLPLVVMPKTELEKAARAQGCSTIGEIYADRNYNDDATLVSRDHDNALIEDPILAAERMVEAVLGKVITTLSGKRIAIEAQTICVHGDNPQALEMAVMIREKLEKAGIRIAKFQP